MDKALNTIKYILVSLGLILFYLLFTSLVASILYLFGIDYNSFSQTGKTILMFSCNIVVLVTICGIYFKSLKDDFKNFFNKNIFDNLENSFKYWLLGFIVMYASNAILAFFTHGIAGNEEGVREMIKLMPIYMAFDVCLYAPLLEELIFRRSIRDITDNKWVYVLLSGLIFGGLHIVGTYNNIIDLFYIIPYSSLGIAFAYSYYKSNNIYSTISMHVMHNTMTFVLLLLYGSI